ncbi:hypothetical protein QJQ45_008369 [Haematococcus lacustris]|nr:hypothetical protein QJQ45_008369 [Haematococcus lacustris]
MSSIKNRKRPVSPAPSAAGANGSGQQDQGQGEAVKVDVKSFIGQPSQGFPSSKPSPRALPPPDPACPPYAHPRLATRSSPRTAAAPAQLHPSRQLDIFDPQLLAQMKDALELLTNVSVLEHSMCGPHHRSLYACKAATPLCGLHLYKSCE